MDMNCVDQQFTASVSILNPERNKSVVPLVSLLNNAVKKMQWISENNFSPVILPPIPLGECWMIYLFETGWVDILICIIACIILMVISKS